MTATTAPRAADGPATPVPRTVRRRCSESGAAGDSTPRRRSRRQAGFPGAAGAGPPGCAAPAAADPRVERPGPADRPGPTAGCPAVARCRWCRSGSPGCPGGAAPPAEFPGEIARRSSPAPARPARCRLRPALPPHHRSRPGAAERWNHRRQLRCRQSQSQPRSLR